MNWPVVCIGEGRCDTFGNHIAVWMQDHGCIKLLLLITKPIHRQTRLPARCSSRLRSEAHQLKLRWYLQLLEKRISAFTLFRKPIAKKSPSIFFFAFTIDLRTYQNHPSPPTVHNIDSFSSSPVSFSVLSVSKPNMACLFSHLSASRFPQTSILQPSNNASSPESSPHTKAAW